MKKSFVPSAVLALGFALSVLTACSSTNSAALGAREQLASTTLPSAPVADVRPHEIATHGHTRVDDYYWLNQREDPDVIAYLEAENAYTAAATEHTAELREKLFDEIVARIDPTDASVPYELDGYWYSTRYVEGGDYPLYVRRKGAIDGPEEVLLDGNALGAGQEYFAIGGFAVSDDNATLAYGVDTVGRRKYDVRFKNIASGEHAPETLAQVTGNMAWAADGRTLFYSRQDPATLRAYQVWRHTVGTDPASDTLVFQEDDDEFQCFIGRTKSKRFLVIGCSQTLTTEFHYLEASKPDGKFQVVLPRERGHDYSVEHFGEHFYIVTNDRAKNFRLVRSPIANTAKSAWEEVVAHRDDALIESIEILARHLVVRERVDGLARLRVKPWDGSAEHTIAFDEPAYALSLSDNRTFDTNNLRFVYTSLTTPSSVYDYDLATRERTLRKQTKVIGGYDATQYVSERLWAVARDGVRVPISLVQRRDTPRDGSAPLLLYGYGSYGNSLDATFSSARLSLLDRGFVFAIAHVRGGKELGERWYEDGKLLRKKNTFTDFIDCAEFLLKKGYSSKDRMYAQGGSAGGLLMGAVINLRPDLFHGVIADVPFVDVVTTMLDDTIPLTTFEYDEWGNPNDKAYYDYMLSYSPYDQVRATAYPHLLVTTGLHDSQVQYFEPAKWVAKLRAMKTDDNLLLLRTNMAAGHGGASGRLRRNEEAAFAYAFLLDLAGRADASAD
jgi:oligopeptidase B